MNFPFGMAYFRQVMFRYVQFMGGYTAIGSNVWNYYQYHCRFRCFAHVYWKCAEPNSGMMISLQGSSWVNWLCSGRLAVDMANECKRLIEKEGKFFDM